MTNTLQDLLDTTSFNITVSDVTLIPCKDIKYLSEVFITKDHFYLGIIDTEDWDWVD